jgi:phage shock protein PspC (stress-responsive transcriptional regulator)
MLFTIFITYTIELDMVKLLFVTLVVFFIVVVGVLCWFIYAKKNNRD